MTRAVIDDSDVDEELSPVKEDHHDLIITGESRMADPSPFRTRSHNFADELDIAPNSPTRELLRRSHSTTMDRLKKKPKTYGSRAGLEDLGVNRALFDGSWAKDTVDESVQLGQEDVDQAPSTISRDGDGPDFNAISMSSPDFARAADMPPPQSTRQNLSFNSTLPNTQAMSDRGENPLNVLVQPLPPDDLPSTKPSTEPRSSDAIEIGRAGSLSGAQDELALAAQIGTELLNTLETDPADVPKAELTVMLREDQETDEFQDGLAMLELEAQKSVRKTSRKRKQTSTGDAHSSSRKRVKEVENEDEDVDELFIGLPKENYQPRKSRLRAYATEVDLSEIDFSKRPEAAVLKEKKSKLKRRQTTGGAVVVDIDDDDPFAEVQKEEFIPAKSRSRRKGRIIKEVVLEDLEQPFHDESREASIQPESNSDAIVVGGTSQIDRVETVEGEHRNAKKGKKDSRSKRNKFEARKHGNSQKLPTKSNNTEAPTLDEDVLISEAVASKTTESLEKLAPELPDEGLEQDEQETIIISPKKVRSRSSMVNKEQDSREDIHGEEPIDVESSVPVSKALMQSRGGDTKRARCKKNSFEILDEDNILEDDTATLQEAPVDEDSVIREVDDADSRSQPLIDKTNVKAQEKPTTPEKDEKGAIEKGPTKHSPLKNSQIRYRVGLSKKSRIAPLLKIVRKDNPVAAPVKKKKT